MQTILYRMAQKICSVHNYMMMMIIIVIIIINFWRILLECHVV